MSYPLNYPTPQNANVQIFYNGNTSSGGALRYTRQSWIKPQGASFVWFTLIGGGGGGAASDGSQQGGGGGSGAVTNFMCPAFLIPDQLTVWVDHGGNGGSTSGADGSPANGTYIYLQQKSGTTPYQLLNAGGGAGGSVSGGGAGGSAMTANNFTAIGFFQSIAGQNGSFGTLSASATTFLSAGTSTTVTPNYGYATNKGYFQMSPIIVGCGGTTVNSIGQPGGIGCGGGGQFTGGPPYTGGNGGPGLVVIITW